jgi:hypothetical protein
MPCAIGKRCTTASRAGLSPAASAYTHHNGAAEVLAESDGRTRFVWTSDLRPDALAEPTAGAMEHSLAAIKRNLESGVLSTPR